MIPKHPPKVNLWTGSRGRAASNQASAFSQRGKTLNPTVTTNAVNDDVDAALVGKISHFFSDVRRLVVDPMFGAELVGHCQFVFAARCDDDMCADLGSYFESGGGDS